MHPSNAPKPNDLTAFSRTRENAPTPLSRQIFDRIQLNSPGYEPSALSLAKLLTKGAWLKSLDFTGFPDKTKPVCR